MTEEKIEKQKDYILLVQLMKFLTPHKFIFMASLLCLIFATAGELLVPIIIEKTIDEDINFQQVELDGTIEEDGNGIINTREQQNVIEQHKTQLKTKSLILLGILILVMTATIGQVYFAARTGQNVMKDIRMQMMNHTIRQSLGFLSKTPTGNIISRITNDTEKVNDFFTTVSISIFKDIIMIIGSAATMLAMDARLGAITMAAVSPVIVLTILFRYFARDSYRKIRLNTSKLNTFLSEHIAGISLVQMFTKEQKTADSFGEINNALTKAEMQEIKVFGIFRPLINMLSSITIGIMIYYSAGLHEQGLIRLGIIIAFIDLIRKFFRPILDLSEKFGVMQSAFAGFERISTFLNKNEKIADEGARTTEIKGSIKFKDINFAYNPSEPVLKNLSLTINEGETAAIAGYTGSGKTTVINLLSRLWDIQSGEIKIDNSDIRKYPLQHLRKSIMTVQQDLFLFSGTIRENICLGENFSDEQIMKAASTVYADQLIKRLPDGLETEVAEEGKNFSTGEKQLIAFTRIIAHNPRILILDEATGNIDQHTDSLIQQALTEIFKNRTSIVIAHRLSTIRNADKIFVLKDGKLAEEGTHTELFEKKQLYYNLCKLQYGEENQDI